MMPFEYFLEKKEVKKSTPDLNLAKSLIKDMRDRIKKSEMLDIEIFSKLIFENIYDALRDFCDAILSIEGFKSYSHQASIVYLHKKGFDFPTLKEFEQFRYKRNSSKYYGGIISKDDAVQIKKFYFSVKDKINKLILDKELE